MSYFPFFVEIGQKRCLVVGGGTVCFQKIENCCPFGVEITVVSPSFFVRKSSRQRASAAFAKNFRQRM